MQCPAPDDKFLTGEGLKRIHGKQRLPSLVPDLPQCLFFLCLPMQTLPTFQNFIQKQKDSGVFTPMFQMIAWEQGLAASILMSDDVNIVENIGSHSTC